MNDLKSIYDQIKIKKTIAERYLEVYKQSDDRAHLKKAKQYLDEAILLKRDYYNLKFK